MTTKYTKLMLIVALSGLVLLMVSCAVARSADKKSATDRDTFAVQKVDYPVQVTASGILEAQSNVSIGAPRVQREVRFKLTRIVEEGKEVAEGDFLLEYDGADIARRLREESARFLQVQQELQKKRSDFEIQLREMKLQVEQAKADLEKLNNKLSQQQELESRIMVEETRMRRDQAQKRFDLLTKKQQYMEESGRLNMQLSRSNENNYKRRIDRLQDAIDALTVRAPVPGVVILRRDWSGEAKQVGNYISLTDIVIDLPDLKTLRVKAMVDEVDAGKIRLGQKALVQVDAVKGRVVEAEISSISGILRQASYDRPQKIAEVFLKLTDSNLAQMRPGMSAKSLIEVDRYLGVLVVPVALIVEKEGRSFVQVVGLNGEKDELREIQIRISDGTTAVVSSGVKEGEKIRSKPTLTT